MNDEEDYRIVQMRALNKDFLDRLQDREDEDAAIRREYGYDPDDY